MSDLPEMLPCPFCGGPAKMFVRRSQADRWIATIECVACLVAPVHVADDEQVARASAIDRWNRRAPMPEKT